MVVFVGFSQCFTTTSCTGGTVPASTARECCVETNEGLSFSDGGTCTVCIGNMQVCTIVSEISVCTYIGIGMKASSFQVVYIIMTCTVCIGIYIMQMCII